MYNISTKKIYHDLIVSCIPLAIGIGLLVAAIISIIQNNILLFSIFLISFILLLILTFFITRKSFKKLKNIKRLQVLGELVSKLPYETVFSDFYTGDVKMYHAVVKYNYNGKDLTLLSDHYPFWMFQKHPTMDLLIDPMDSNCYYLDFDIHRKNDINS